MGRGKVEKRGCRVLRDVSVELDFEYLTELYGGSYLC